MAIERKRAALSRELTASAIRTLKPAAQNASKPLSRFLFQATRFFERPFALGGRG